MRFVFHHHSLMWLVSCNVWVNPFTPKWLPIDELNRLALDRVKCAIWAPTGMKGLIKE